MEQQLKYYAEGSDLGDLTITYCDMHGLWGGIIVTLSTDGAYERLERKPGAGAPDLIRGVVAPARVRDVICLLSEIKAWEQLTPERTLVPDESRATLMLRAGDVETSIWEWYNDLAKNARLIRVRSLLFELATEVQAA